MKKEEVSLNKAIIDIRVKLQNSKIKKSGKNKFAGFSYYELADFLPTLNELMKEDGINDIFSIDDGKATLTLIKEDKQQVYNMPFVMFDTPLNKNGQPSMQHIQYLGALNTYYKRYLYLNAFGITDGEVIDGMDNSNNSNHTQKPQQSDKQIKYNQFKAILQTNKITEKEFLKYLEKVGVKLAIIIDNFIAKKDIQDNHIKNCLEFLASEVI